MRRLITIPISHFCEKARWALGRAGLEYQEEAHVQVIHVIAARRAGGGRTVPVLVCDEGVLPESGSIVGYAAQRAPADRAFEPDDPVQLAEAVRIERWLDADLGPHTRRWTYWEMRDERELAEAYNLTGVPDWERASFPVLYRPLFEAVKRVLDVTPETTADSKLRVRALFDTVGERLADGRPFLVGERFSRADLSFAALAAPVLMPDQYGIPLPKLHELPAAWAEDIADLRAHPAGAFALRMFADYR
ncbi:MAG TPA: glutathione S-transferase family protein [Solirubrobacteraceae bacterium]|jgi:glutathione S-transferase|nr:glutathione S-transferase family protein [Solirubrobacteraceae bacterium]